MGRIEKTVFLSYRRTNAPWALAIFQKLTQHGYDVFFDFMGLASGDFETVILENIKARAHFIVLLTPSALERCGEPGDWLRREIESALEWKRNMVPLMLEGFDFGTPTIANQLTGRLSVLKQYNALRVPVEYFEEAMSRLRERYLNIPLDGVTHPASTVAIKAAQKDQKAASLAPAIEDTELSAQQWFERAFISGDPEEKLRCYNEAIRLKPDYAMAYIHRGNTRHAQGDRDGAIKDFSDAIRLKPNHAKAYYYNRAGILKAKASYEASIADFQEYLQLRAGIRDGDQAEIEQIIRDLREKLKQSSA